MLDKSGSTLIERKPDLKMLETQQFALWVKLRCLTLEKLRCFEGL